MNAGLLDDISINEREVDQMWIWKGDSTYSTVLKQDSSPGKKHRVFHGIHTVAKFLIKGQLKTAVQDAIKINKLPKNLTLKITKARSDKSFWLDQKCSVDFPDVTTPDCQAGDVNSSKIMVVYGDSLASISINGTSPQLLSDISNQHYSPHSSFSSLIHSGE